MDRMPATIDGFECEILSAGDETTGSVAEHKLIGYDGAALEDCGIDSQRYTFQTIWSGENYLNHFAFREKYRTKRGLNEIFHPVYGLLKGKIKKIGATHEADEIDCVSIDIEFTEEGTSEFSTSARMRTNTRSVAEVGQEVADEVVARVSRSIFGAARNRLNRLKAAINRMESRVNLGVSIMNDHVKALIFPLSIPGIIAKNAFLICASLKNAGNQIANSPKNGLIALLEQTRAIGQLFGRTDGAIENAIVEAGTYLSAFMTEEAFREIGERDTSVVSLQAGSVRSVVEPVEALSKRDVDEMVSTVRRSTSEIYDAPQALKEVALIVAEAGREALARIGGERIVEIKSETNIYSVLMGARVDRARAFDVCLRNNIENPNRVIGTVYLPQEDF